MSTFKQQFSKALLSLVLLGFYSVGGVAPALAAPAVPGVPAEKVVSADELNAKIEEIEAAQDLDEAVKGKLVELYRQALRQLERVRSNESSAKAFEEARKTAPEETAALRKKLEQAEAKPVTPEALKITNRTSLGDLEQRLVKEKANLTALETKLADVEKSLSDEKTRPQQIRDRLTALKDEQEDIEKELKTQPPSDEAERLTNARQQALELRSRAARAEVHMLDQELLSQGVRVDLLKAQRDATSQSVANVRAGVKLLEELVNQRRLDEAEKAQAAAAEAEREAVGKHPAIRQLAENNAALTRELAKLTGDLERVTKRREQVIDKSADIKQDFQTAQQRLAIAGLSETLGRILLEQRRKLPDLVQYRRDMAARKSKVSEIGLSEVRVEEETRDLRDVNAAMVALLAEHADHPVPAEEHEAFRQELRDGLKDRKALLGQATSTYGTYLKALASLDYAEEQLLDAADQYREFLDEHLLWLPSAPPMSSETLEKLVFAIGWLLSPANWFSVAEALLSDLVDAPYILPTGLLLIGILLFNGRRLHGLLMGLGKDIGKLSKDNIGLTFQALGVTLLLAVGWPALLGFVGWRLQVTANAADFARHVGAALLVAAPMLLNLLAFQRFCLRGGVAERHFGWSATVVNQLRLNLHLLIIAALPTVFVAAIGEVSDQVAYRDSLSRVSFAVVMVLLMYFFWRVLNPRTGVLASRIKRNPKGWLARLRYVWYGLVLGTLFALIVLDGLGYYHTAWQLAAQVVDTLWLVVGLGIFYDLVIRWLTLTRRKLALRQLREKREAERAARAAEQAGEAGGQPLPEFPEEEGLDLEAVDVQTRKLLDVAIALSAAVGLWLIWVDVLPALGILDQVALWQQTVTVEGVEKLAPVTLTDLTLALLIALLTVVASKNLPGVLEIALLQRLALTSGSRYAITT
ncbi:MAG: mechanosensitive ion channel protein MscS, partial [Gammaproteobacteria bacterium]|nr:mechanosensitive ion channel protein MscS [Gammaproteobacteria bacterium]